jgi:hypothetical protein
MYRTLVTHGPLVGVPSGPYVGGEREVDFHRLPPASQTRLLAAMAGRGAIHPILKTDVRATLRAFRPGVYLFPIDVVDARNPWRMRVLPLGSVHSARISQDGPRVSLVLVFADGGERSFPVKGQAEAEEVWKLLERAQRRLEELTYGGDLAAAVSLDPFYEVRADGAWESVAPGARPSFLARNRSLRYVPALLALGLPAAVGFRCHRVESARRAPAAEIPFGGAGSPDTEPTLVTVVRHGPATPEEIDAAIGRFRARAASATVADRVEGMVRAGAFQQRPLRVAFSTTLDPSLEQAGVALPFARREAEARKDVVIRVLAIVFSEAIPSRVLPIVHAQAERPPGEPWLSVVVRHTWQTRAATPGLETVFDASFDPADGKPPIVFRLTMPPSEKPEPRVRDRSLFAKPRRPDPAEALVEAMFSRAYDRLYDELYGMFFGGDPRIPLSSRAEMDEVARSFGMATPRDTP